MLNINSCTYSTNNHCLKFKKHFSFLFNFTGKRFEVSVNKFLIFKINYIFKKNSMCEKLNGVVIKIV